MEAYNITGPAVQTIVNLRDVFENETGILVGITQYLCAYAVRQNVGPEPQPVGRTTLTPSLLLLAVTTLTISSAVIIRRRKSSARQINDLDGNGMNPALHLLPRRMLHAVGALRKVL